MSATDQDRIYGQCHCGAVEISVPSDTDFSAAGRCDCSFCRRRWAPNVGVPRLEVEVTRGEDVLVCYQFGTGTAEHYFCSRCGIYTHHRRRSNPDECGVNVGCFDGVFASVKMEDYNLSPIFDGINHPSDHPGDR